MKQTFTLFFLASFSIFLLPTKANEAISYQQKLEAIESLKSYQQPIQPQQSDQELGNSNDSPPAAGGAPMASLPGYIIQGSQAARAHEVEFSCVDDSEYSCEMQEAIHRIENRKEPVFIVDGQYRVKIFFQNDLNFPSKSVGEKTFKSITKEEQDDVEIRIYKHYLGSGFALYKPEVINSNAVTTGIAIFVSNGEELNRFLDDQRVQGIYHIGNSLEIPEGY